MHGNANGPAQVSCEGSLIIAHVPIDVHYYIDAKLGVSKVCLGKSLY